MPRARKNYTPLEKVSILKRHLVEKVPVSDLCEELGINANLFYQWQKTFFENAVAAFERPRRRGEDPRDRRIAALEVKLQQKNEVLAELMQEHVELKKELGEL
jgi:transposase-like protein